MNSALIFKLLIILLIIWLIFLTIRSARYLKIGSQLIEQASTTKSFSVGNGNSILNYVVLGDSTAVGVGASKLETTYAYQFADTLAEKNSATIKATIIAVSGARLTDVLNNQLPQLKELKPDIISISIGGNDATHLTKTAQFSQDFQALLNQLQQLGIKEAFITNTPDMHRIPALPTLAWLVSGWRSAVQSDLVSPLINNSGYHLVDIYHQAKLQGIPDYAADRFHPNDQGYQRWTKAFINAL